MVTMGQHASTARSTVVGLVSLLVVAGITVLAWQAETVTNRDVVLWSAAAITWVATTTYVTTVDNSTAAAIGHGALGFMLAIAVAVGGWWANPLAVAMVPALMAHLAPQVGRGRRRRDRPERLAAVPTPTGGPAKPYE